LSFASIFVLIVYIFLTANATPPDVDENFTVGKREKVGENHYRLGANYLRKNQYGIWEMYIEGEPYERGLIYGELSKELIQYQEDVFVAQIDEFVPSDFWKQFLLHFIGFFNSDLTNYIPLENQQEIYGISKSFSDKYDHYATKYTRIINYHAAHDIGHALNDYSMVGCTSFSLNNSRTENGDLLIGRNFDFYVGDDFANEKLILFVNPSKGYSFTSYSWAGFTGIASGLNEKGLSVTINASKSDLPTASKMPISLLAREILQYASTIEEAIAIAKKRKTFVSETLMIGSAKDNKTILIEKSPTKMGVYDSKEDQVICANHYQSAAFKNDRNNTQNIQTSDSKYRYDRVTELLKQNNRYEPSTVLSVLRDQYAKNNDTLGMGNPRALNQLIAHHSVIIQPKQGVFYVTTHDYQLGPLLGYDLNKTFATKKISYSDSLPASPFLKSAAYQQFKQFKKTKQAISAYLLKNVPLSLSEKQIKAYIANNSESYLTYETLGKYFVKKGKQKKAIAYFELALTKNTASEGTRKELKQLIHQCKLKKK
jgi:predicted choloylglycine hydrolase